MDLQLKSTALDINIGGNPVSGTPAVSRTVNDIDKDLKTCFSFVRLNCCT